MTATIMQYRGKSAILVLTSVILSGCGNTLAEGPAASTPASPPEYHDTSWRADRRSPCGYCGVVESIEPVKVKGEAGGLGAVVGGVVGGIVGNQVGKGTGKDVATVAGAVGGAIAGNEIEKSRNSAYRYNVTVRMEDGGTRTLALSEPPPFEAGSAVEVHRNRISPRTTW